MARPATAASNAATRRQFFKIAGIGARGGRRSRRTGQMDPQHRRGRGQPQQRRPAGTGRCADDSGGTSLDVPGISPFVTDNADFYRVDTAFVVPRVTTDIWELRIHGMVDNEITLSYADLTAMPSIERMVTLTCVSNEVGGDLAGNAVLAGRPDRRRAGDGGPAGRRRLRALDQRRRLHRDHPARGTDRRPRRPVRLRDERRAAAGRARFPGADGRARAVRLRLGDQVGRRPQGHDLRRARPPTGPTAAGRPQAPIKTSSRIDVPKSFDQVSKGTVAIAGVAWAQHRGIPACRCRSTTATGRTPPCPARSAPTPGGNGSYQWDATETGQHTIRCRAIDGTGAVQTEQIQGVMPDGATGWDSRSVTVTA